MTWPTYDVVVNANAGSGVGPEKPDSHTEDGSKEARKPAEKPGGHCRTVVDEADDG